MVDRGGGPDPRRDRGRRRRAARAGAARGRARRSRCSARRSPTSVELHRAAAAAAEHVRRPAQPRAGGGGADRRDRARSGARPGGSCWRSRSSSSPAPARCGSAPVARQRSARPELEARGTRAPAPAGTSGTLGLGLASARRARRSSRACCARRAGGGSGRRARRRSPSCRRTLGRWRLHYFILYSRSVRDHVPPPAHLPRPLQAGEHRSRSSSPRWRWASRS